jgi:hypothetical protein
MEGIVCRCRKIDAMKERIHRLNKKVRQLDEIIQNFILKDTTLEEVLFKMTQVFRKEYHKALSIGRDRVIPLKEMSELIHRDFGVYYPTTVLLKALKCASKRLLGLTCCKTSSSSLAQEVFKEKYHASCVLHHPDRQFSCSDGRFLWCPSRNVTFPEIPDGYAISTDNMQSFMARKLKLPVSLFKNVYGNLRVGDFVSKDGMCVRLKEGQLSNYSSPNPEDYMTLGQARDYCEDWIRYHPEKAPKIYPSYKVIQSYDEWDKLIGRKYEQDEVDLFLTGWKDA